MNWEDRLKSFLAVVVDEARRNQEFAASLNDALGGAVETRQRRGRRDAPVLDPYALFEQGADVLLGRLQALDVKSLKDIVAHHGMDRQRLAMRWRSKDRLVELLMERVEQRATKGDVFLD